MLMIYTYLSDVNVYYFRIMRCGCSTKQHVKHTACIESYISRAKRRIDSHGEPDFTKVQRDRRHRNGPRRIPRIPG